MKGRDVQGECKFAVGFESKNWVGDSMGEESECPFWNIYKNGSNVSLSLTPTLANLVNSISFPNSWHGFFGEEALAVCD